VNVQGRQVNLLLLSVIICTHRYHYAYRNKNLLARYYSEPQDLSLAILGRKPLIRGQASHSVSHLHRGVSLQNALSLSSRKYQSFIEHNPDLDHGTAPETCFLLEPKSQP
jgi:hypothetical protein